MLKFTPGTVTKGSTVAFFTDTSLTTPTTALLVSPSGPDLVPTARIKIGGAGATAQVLTDSESMPDGKVSAVYQSAATPTTLYLAELDYNGAPVSSTKQALTGVDPQGVVAPSAGTSLTVTAVKTANYAAAANEVVRFDTTSGALVLTLPTAPADGTVVGGKIVTQGGTNGVTVNCGGSDAINKTGGVATFAMTLLGQAFLAKYRATDATWTITDDDLPLSQLDSRFQAAGLAALKASNLSDLASAAAARSNLGVASVDAQFFASSGTWAKPTGCTSTMVVVVGGGGGGGSGRRGAAASQRAGGGGGGGGGFTSAVLRTADLGATETVTVGAAGAGGAAITANDTNGNTGSAGGTSSFSATPVATAAGGAGGGAGSASSPAGGAGGLGLLSGGAGGAANGTFGSAGVAGACSGGGGGSGFNASDATGGSGPAGASLISGAGTPTIPGAGGHGGAGNINSNPGFAGTGYGGGGGGGGGSTNGTNSGAGGAGAAGMVLVISW